MTDKRIQCIICKGKGSIQKPRKWPSKKDELELKVMAIRTLYNAHYSLRQIRDLLGYKSVRSIQVLLDK